MKKKRKSFGTLQQLRDWKEKEIAKLNDHFHKYLFTLQRKCRHKKTETESWTNYHTGVDEKYKKCLICGKVL